MRKISVIFDVIMFPDHLMRRLCVKFTRNTSYFIITEILNYVSLLSF